VIFELENHEIRLMLFLTCLRHYKKVFNLFIKNMYQKGSNFSGVCRRGQSADDDYNTKTHVRKRQKLAFFQGMKKPFRRFSQRQNGD